MIKYLGLGWILCDALPVVSYMDPKSEQTVFLVAILGDIQLSRASIASSFLSFSFSLKCMWGHWMLDKKNMGKRHFISREDQNKFSDRLYVPHAHILQVTAAFDSPHTLENWLRLLRLHTPMFDSFQSYNFSNALFIQIVHRGRSSRSIKLIH